MLTRFTEYGAEVRLLTTASDDQRLFYFHAIFDVAFGVVNGCCSAKSTDCCIYPRLRFLLSYCADIIRKAHLRKD